MVRLNNVVQAVREVPYCFTRDNYNLCAGYARSHGRRFHWGSFLVLVWADFRYIASGRRSADDCREADQQMLDNAY